MTEQQYNTDKVYTSQDMDTANNHYRHTVQRIEETRWKDIYSLRQEIKELKIKLWKAKLLTNKL